MLSQTIKKNLDSGFQGLSILRDDSLTNSDSDEDHPLSLNLELYEKPKSITLTQRDSLKDKLVALAKKARNLNVLYESEKTRANRLEKQLKLEILNQKDTSNQKTLEPDKLVRDKLQLSIRKLEEERNNNQRLKLQLMQLNKTLQRETGQDITQIEENGWKGRQEQIILLKEKVKDLTTKLRSQSATEPRNTSIQKIENAKKLELAKTKENMEQLQKDMQSLKLKYDASISRNRVLEKETKDFRNKLKTCIQKSENDDKLITALRMQLKNEKSTETKKNTILFENLKQLCSEQEETIRQLRARNPSLHENGAILIESFEQEITQLKSLINSQQEQIIEKNEQIQSFIE